jgi:hypothetical protein
MEDGLMGTMHADKVAGVKVPIDTLTPSVHHRGTVPDKPKQPSLFVHSPLIPDEVPTELESGGKNPTPFPSDRIGNHVPLTEELPPQLSREVHEGDMVGLGQFTARTPLSSPTTIVSSKPLFGPLEFVWVPTKGLDFSKVEVHQQLLRATSHSNDPDSTKPALHRNTPVSLPILPLEVGLGKAPGERQDIIKISIVRKPPALVYRPDSQFRDVTSEKYHLREATTINFKSIAFFKDPSYHLFKRYLH